MDKKAPSITISSPVGGTVYILNQPVSANYACSDGGSGVATCAGPVASGSNFQTGAAGSPVFTVNATDNVANPSTASVNYVVAYNICMLYDAAKAKRAGSTIPIKLQLCDYNHANVSTPSFTVTATGVTQVSTSAPGVLEDAGAANPDNNFGTMRRSAGTSSTCRRPDTRREPTRCYSRRQEIRRCTRCSSR